jgi:hypothetical protein
MRWPSKFSKVTGVGSKAVCAAFSTLSKMPLGRSLVRSRRRWLASEPNP